MQSAFIMRRQERKHRMSGCKQLKSCVVIFKTVERGTAFIGPVTECVK